MQPTQNELLRQKETELWQWHQARQLGPLHRLQAQPSGEPVQALTLRDTDTDGLLLARIWAVGDALKQGSSHWQCQAYDFWVGLVFDGRTLVGSLQLYERQ